MEAQVGLSNIEAGKTKVSSDTSFKNLLKNRKFVSSVIIYCIFSLHDVAYLEVIFSYMIMRVTSVVAVQYARMPIISLWPLRVTSVVAVQYARMPMISLWPLRLMLI